MNVNTTITRKKEIDFLQFNKLLEFEDKLVHAIFLKKHNIGFNLQDCIGVRDKSISVISKKFKINKNRIVQSHQTHSNNIKEYNEKTEIEQNVLNDYDGYVCNKKDIATIITFADCIPVFIYDPKNNVYANIHSGWRGVVNQISIKAIQTLVRKYNSSLSSLICCIGPNIRRECFLVNEDLVQIYNENFKDYIKSYPIIEETDLHNDKGKQYKIDNNLLLELLLKENGVLDKNIINSEICTVCNSNDFHSRRAEGENFQKGGGLMMLKC